MKTNINIFNNLNESLEKELKRKRNYKKYSAKNKKLNEAENNSVLNKEKIANFLKEAVETLTTTEYTCSEYKLDNNLSLFVGWSGGYDEDDDTVIHDEKEPTYAINAGIKGNEDYLKTDYDFLNFPFDETTGDVWDSGTSISPDEDYSKLADWFIKEYKGIRKALDNGEIILECKKGPEEKPLNETDSNISDLANEIYEFYDNDMGTHFDEILGNEEEVYNDTLAMLENKEENRETLQRILDEIRESEVNDELANKLEAYLNESSINESEDEYEAAKYKGKEWGIFAKKSNAWVVFGTEKEMKERAKKLNKKAKEDLKEEVKQHNFTVLRNGNNEGIYFVTKEEAENYIEECKKRNINGDFKIVNSGDLKEEEIVRINDTETNTDYLIQDVTVLDQVGDGDVQSPDIEALLTLVDSALKESYSENWGHIKTLSSKIDENNSYALVDISTPEILKEFESRGIKDAAIGKNLILEKVDNKLVEFKVNNLNGTTKYSKKTTNPQQAIYEWIESEFLQEAKEEKAKEAEVAKAKTEKETVENYINNRLDLKMEIENIKMFIELSKEVKAEEEMKPSIQNRMYAFAVEVPYNIEVTNKDDKYELSFANTDEVVAMIFGKEWVKETTPDNEVIGVIKESEDKFKDMVMELHGYVEANPQTISSDLKKAIKNKTVDDYLSTKAGMSFEEIEDFMNRYSLTESQKINETTVKELWDYIESKPNLNYITKLNNPQEVSDMLDIEAKTDKDLYKLLHESQKINESYEQFNIGEIEVVFNPDTYETLYSIPSADVQDKKINLTKVPTVDTPYDTDTIIKSYIETKFGRIPTEEEKEMIDNGEVSEPQPEESEPAPETQEEIPQEEIPQDDSDLTEDELPDEPEENEVPDEVEPEEGTPEAETGSAVFMKIRPKQNSSVEDLRRRQLDGDTPTSNYIVVDTLELSPEEFNDLISNLSEQRSYLEGIQALDRKNYSFNVIKVTSSDSSYDLLIDPLGYNYPRYVAISDKDLNGGI